MGLVSYLYKKNFVGRYDKEAGFPYCDLSYFQGLNKESYTFTNSKGIEIAYFFYYYPNYNPDKIILFCHGLGPGHTAYLAEINCLAERGYKVLTLDYAGCDKSKGKGMGSINGPTRDVMDLLDYLKLKEEVTVMGHSLGGFTSLNIIHLRDEINKAIIMSGFLTIPLSIPTMIKSKFIQKGILRYERKVEPLYFALDNIDYLKTTKDQIYFIQSEDDQVVPYSISLEVVEKIDNPCIKTLKVINRKHNPNYTDEAVQYMNEVFGDYYQKLRNKEIKTDADKINYFKDVSLSKLTAQDQKMFDSIKQFIEQ